MHPRSRWTLPSCWAVAAPLALVACGGAATPAPATTANEAKAEPKAAVATKAPAVSSTASTTDEPKDDGLPPGILLVTAPDAGLNSGRVPVNPTTLDLSALPEAKLPKPLDAKDAPKTLPKGPEPKHIEIEKIDSGWRARGANGSAVYVVLKEKLGRIQIGTIDPNRNATDRVYRTCGDRYYENPMLTPARWQTLSLDGDKVKLTVVDAWFDAKSCQASIAKTTTIEPKPLLGTMLLAYRRSCDDCGPGGRVVFIAPPLSQVAASGLGGDSTVSHGAFTIVELPLRRGGAASFTGQVSSHQMKTWNETLRGDVEAESDDVMKSMGQGDLVLGAEIQQAVSDPKPIAITYATLFAQ
jgi:hypothetical protein